MNASQHQQLKKLFGASISLALFVFSVLPTCRAQSPSPQCESPWLRHTIDSGHRGADGVRLGDFNGDGLMDVVTGWEESGLIRLYVHPGHTRARQPWPATTIAEAASPEDAVPMDLDDDGRLDIVSCHEGKRRQVLVHWNNGDQPWTTTSFPQLDGVMWMYALPLTKLNSRRALVVGSKGKNASITLMLSPTDSQKANRRKISQWKKIPLRNAGWIMSLRAIDMDHDGDRDIVFSDRKGNHRRAGWLEQPSRPDSSWKEHSIAGDELEVLFLTATPNRCLIATRNSITLDCRSGASGWDIQEIANPPEVPLGKAVERLPDDSIVLTANSHSSSHPMSPGIWIRCPKGAWSPIDETPRVKFDRMEILDLDGDGDLDIMTCEERQNLGVIWYENPQVTPIN